MVTANDFWQIAEILQVAGEELKRQGLNLGCVNEKGIDVFLDLAEYRIKEASKLIKEAKGKLKA